MNPSKSNIKAELKKHEKNLKRTFFLREVDTFTLKATIMGGNTARAYKRGKCYMEHTPSSILKNWIHNYYFQNKKRLALLHEGQDFTKIHSSAVNALDKFWRKTEPDAMGLEYYHFAKLIDLFFKTIPNWGELKKDRKEWYYNHVNVPIDKYSLLILRECHPKYRGIKTSMNFVKDKRHYDKIQKDIREMIAPFPPLLFDLYAWDYRRKKMIEDEETFQLVKA